MKTLRITTAIAEKIPAGPKLDWLVQQSMVSDDAERPYQPGITEAAMPFSQDPLAALVLIETFATAPRGPTDNAPEFTLTRNSDGQWECTIEGQDGGHSWYCEATGPTLALAVSRAIVQELDE